MSINYKKYYSKLSVIIHIYIYIYIYSFLNALILKKIEKKL